MSFWSVGIYGEGMRYVTRQIRIVWDVVGCRIRPSLRLVDSNGPKRPFADRRLLGRPGGPHVIPAYLVLVL